MRRLSGWSATGVGLVSVRLDTQHPSGARAQHARNVAPVLGVWADSLSWAEEISPLQAAGLNGPTMQNPLDLADDVTVTRPVASCMTDPQFSMPQSLTRANSISFGWMQSDPAHSISKKH